MANIPVSTEIDNLLKSTPSTTVTTVAALTALGAATTGGASIVAADLATGAVTEAKILDGAVTAGKIGTSAVTVDKIGALAVTDAKLAANAVIEGKIATGAVTDTKLASNAVTADKILAGAVTADKITNGVLTIAKTNGLQSTLDLKQSLRPAKRVNERIVATRFNVFTNTQNTLAVQSRTGEIEFKTTDAASNFCMSWYNPTGGNSVTIKSSFIVGSNIVPVFFNGSRTIVVAPGSIVKSDPIAQYLVKNATFSVRTFADAGIGNVVKANFADYTGGATSKFWDSSDQVDAASPPTVTGNGGFTFSPSFISGLSANPCLAVIGDSTTALGTTSGMSGWVREYFGTYATYTVHQGLLANLAHVAEGSLRLDALTSNVSAQTQRFNAFKYCDTAVIMIGINDMIAGRTAVQVQTDLLTLFNRLDSIGVTVTACTMTPRSSGTFTTVLGQTADATQTPKILFINTWLRTIPSPLVGIIDISDATSSARDSGVWKANYTTDGLHPDTALAISAMVAVMPADIMTR